MANLIFSAQRAANGNAIFSDQVQSQFVVISVALASESQLVAPLGFETVSIASLLNSRSVLSASLQIIDTRMSVNLLSQSVLTPRLRLSALLMSVSMSSSSNLVAALEVRIPVNLSVSLFSVSQAYASLYFSSGSNVPRNAKLRAVPVGEDSMQIIRYRGDTYADAFTVFNEKTGDIVNVGGCTFKMSVAIGTKCDPDRLLQYTLVGIVDDAEEGAISFAPNESQANLTGFFFYDVEMQDSQGVVRTLASDSYVYKQDITP